MIRIVQCLCPARHCIMACAYEPLSADSASGMEFQLARIVGEAISLGHINPYCGICHEPMHAWHYEDAPTRFATMEEARPELERLERENAAARNVLGRHGQN